MIIIKDFTNDLLVDKKIFHYHLVLKAFYIEMIVIEIFKYDDIVIFINRYIAIN